MKQVLLGKHNFSRVVCGSNPFWAHSHFSRARDEEYQARFDDERITRVLECCFDLGINAVESCANERIVSILRSLRAKRSETLHLVGSTRIDETSPLKTHEEKLSCLISTQAAVCVIHAQHVEQPVASAGSEGIRRMVDRIHDAGLLAGMSAHRVVTVERAENEGWGIDTYLFPLNLLGFVYPGYKGSERREDRVNLVRGVAKPFILIKALAAGRIPPAEGLAFVSENAKPNDLLSLGFGNEGEVAESLRWVKKLFC